MVRGGIRGWGKEKRETEDRRRKEEERRKRKKKLGKRRG